MLDAKLLFVLGGDMRFVIDGMVQLVCADILRKMLHFFGSAYVQQSSSQVYCYPHLMASNLCSIPCFVI